MHTFTKDELDYIRLMTWDWYIPNKNKYVWEAPPYLIYEGWFEYKEDRQTVPTAKMRALLELSK